MGLGGANVAVGGNCVDVDGHEDGDTAYAKVAAFEKVVFAVVVHLNKKMFSFSEDGLFIR